jgi:hypothetical protein
MVYFFFDIQDHGKRLPVVLYQPVEQTIWLYVTRFRPWEAASSGSQERVFLSHGVRNYGHGFIRAWLHRRKYSRTRRYLA